MKEPKIRFIGFKGEWETRHVGELCDVLTGFPFEGLKILPKGKELLMRGINITEGFIRHSEDIDRYYDEDSSMLSKYRLQENDLVIGMDGSKVGKNSALVTKKEVNSLLVQRVARLRNNNPHLIHLIQISLGSEKFFEYVDSMKTSSAIPHISPSDIKNFVVSISVNDDEIKLVSDYFQHLDSLIQSTTKKIESLKQVKAASLQSMFPQEGETTPRVRFKGFEGEWEKVRLGELFSERFDRSDVGEMLSVTLNNGIIRAADNGRFDNSSEDKSNYKVVKIGDIAYNTMRMWQGASGCSRYNGIVSPAYTVVVPNDGVCSLFFACYFKTQSIVDLFRLHSQGLTKDTWNLKYPAFKVIELLFPNNIAEQRAVASYFTSLDRQITLHTQRLKKLKQIKSACLDEMFV